MGKFFKLAWRNVWRNRRRSLITMTAIVFAVLVTVMMRSLQYGTYDALESYAVSLFAGEIQIHDRGYQQERTLNYSMPDDPKKWQQLVAAHPGLVAYARRVSSFGLVSSDSSSAGAFIIGVEPEAEQRITVFTRAGMLQAGRPLEKGDRGRVLLGRELARNLHVSVNDTVVVITQGFRNMLGADKYVVKGLMKTGNIEFDRTLMVMPLQDAQALFSMEGRLTELIVKTENFRKADQRSRLLQAALDGGEYEAVPWREMLPELEQTIALDNIGGAVFLMFLLFVVGFEILNTTMMSVMERVKEFGILQALGIKPRQLAWMIFLESMIKITLSLVISMLLAFLIISALKHYPIPLSEEIKEAMSEFGFITDMYFAAKARVYLEPFISVAIISLLSLIYPIRMATKLNPVESMRRA